MKKGLLLFVFTLFSFSLFADYSAHSLQRLLDNIESLSRVRRKNLKQKVDRQKKAIDSFERSLSPAGDIISFTDKKLIVLADSLRKGLALCRDKISSNKSALAYARKNLNMVTFQESMVIHQEIDARMQIVRLLNDLYGVLITYKVIIMREIF